MKKVKEVDLTSNDKVKILKYINKGLTTLEIILKFDNKLSRQQIAAIKAWKTMGKY